MAVTSTSLGEMASSARSTSILRSPMPRSREMKLFGSKRSRSSMVSPFPIKTIIRIIRRCDEYYRESFLKLTRNLAPTGKTFTRLEIKSATDLEKHPIVFVPDSRKSINEVLKSSRKPIEEKEKFEDRKISYYHDQYPWLLGGAFLMLLLEWII
jgi:hypothetical protein